MKKTMTLEIDQDPILFAEAYEKETEQSISDLFESFLTSLKYRTQDPEITQQADALHGIYQDETLPDKHSMRKAFHEKNNGQTRK